MRARVQNGRWVLDEPTDLPEGTVVEIVTRAAPSEAADVYVDDRLRTYVRALLEAASPQKNPASRGIPTAADEEAVIVAAKAAAGRASRSYVSPADIKQVAPETLRRFVLIDDAVRAILDATPVP